MCLAVLFCLTSSIRAQWVSEAAVPREISSLFQDREPLQLKLRYSSKRLKSETNDSTYLSTFLFSADSELASDSIQIKIRARGGFRKKHCYFTPLKVKIERKDNSGTVFSGQEQLKWVLPCLMGMDSDDYVVKEYMAYRLFESLSDFHFKTRLIELRYDEIKGQRTKQHQLMTFLKEHIDQAAERYRGRELNREVHPKNYEPYQAAKQALFQFMIGNTDFSTKKGHNQKLLFINNEIVSLPYDFDMSGLVDASYAGVSNIQNIPTHITDVRERAYKGYPRDSLLMEQVRREFLEKKMEVLAVVDETETYFHDPIQFRTAREYIMAFYGILENDKKYQRFITDRLRTD